jgi:hypothetical protein
MEVPQAAPHWSVGTGSALPIQSAAGAAAACPSTRTTGLAHPGAEAEVTATETVKSLVLNTLNP